MAPKHDISSVSFKISKQRNHKEHAHKEKNVKDT